MKIGILNADHLDRSVIERFGDYPAMFKQLFLAVDSTLHFNVYHVMDNQYPLRIDDCDAYLITGSQYSVYEDVQWIKTLQRFVIMLFSHNVKMIGICFGHQLIAQALKGEVKKSHKGWGVGVVSSHVNNMPDGMAGALSHFSLLMSHQDQVTLLPPDAELIGGNDFCPNACFLMVNKVLSFQGHPEFSVAYMKIILNKRREIIGEGVYAQAMASLDDTIHHLEVARWIVDFIKK